MLGPRKVESCPEARRAQSYVPQNFTPLMFMRAACRSSRTIHLMYAVGQKLGYKAFSGMLRGISSCRSAVPAACPPMTRLGPFACALFAA